MSIEMDEEETIEQKEEKRKKKTAHHKYDSKNAATDVQTRQQCAGSVV
jgi:hypothetical protein